MASTPSGTDRNALRNPAFEKKPLEQLKIIGGIFDQQNHRLSAHSVAQLCEQTYFSHEWSATSGRSGAQMLDPFGGIAWNDSIELAIACSQMFANDLAEHGTIIDQSFEITPTGPIHRPAGSRG